MTEIVLKKTKGRLGLSLTAGGSKKTLPLNEAETVAWHSLFRAEQKKKSGDRRIIFYHQFADALFR